MNDLHDPAALALLAVLRPSWPHWLREHYMAFHRGFTAHGTRNLDTVEASFWTLNPKLIIYSTL